MRERSPGRAPLEGAGALGSGRRRRGGLLPGACRALSGGRGRCPPACAAARIGRRRRRVQWRHGAFAPLAGKNLTGPRRNAGPAGKAGLRPGRGGCAVAEGGGTWRLTIDGCPAGTGRSCGIGSAARRRAGDASAAAAQPAEGLRRQRRGAGKADAPRVDGRRCAYPARRGAAVLPAEPGTAAGAWRSFGGAAQPGAAFGGAAGAAAAAGALAFGGACGLALSSTLRTRSAIWSGTTLSWFLASNIPPKRSLKSVVSSFEVSPTSLASSKIRTFPAKFPLECEAPESHQLECAEPQPTAWLR